MGIRVLHLKIHGILCHSSLQHLIEGAMIKRVLSLFLREKPVNVGVKMTRMEREENEYVRS